MVKLKTVEAQQKEYAKLERAYDRLEVVNQQQEILIKDLRPDNREMVSIFNFCSTITEATCDRFEAVSFGASRVIM